MNTLPSHAVIIALRHEADMVAAIAAYSTQVDRTLTVQHHAKPGSTRVGIYIDDVRQVQEAVRTASAQHQTRVLFADAAYMTTQAQNALLKLLEEPQDGVSLLLITARPALLLATVRSRCQVVPFTAPEVDVAMPSEHRAQIEFMAAGDMRRMQQLAEDKALFEAQAKAFRQAKQFVSGSGYEKLQVVAEVKESRDAALAMIAAALTVCSYLLRRQPSPDLHKKATQLLAADESLRKNAHVRLCLLRCVV